MEATALNKLVCENQAKMLISILREFPAIRVHITGAQGPTGKSTLCRVLKESGVNAFEDWELEEVNKDNPNAVYIEIALNKTITSS